MSLVASLAPTGLLRVYVAATFGDYPRARRAMGLLRDSGAVISHDWTAEADRYPDDDAPKPLAAQHAREDLEGVRTADVVLVLTPADKGRGCGMWIETGAALTLGKLLVIAGPQRERSIFCQLAARYEHDNDAITYVAELAASRSRPTMLRHAVTAEGDCLGWCSACVENVERGLNPDGSPPNDGSRAP